MKVFVASGSGEGCAVAGEVVWLYCNDQPCAECGGEWSVTGVSSGKRAAKFTVADRDISRGAFADMLGDAWLRRGLPQGAGFLQSLPTWSAAQLELAADLNVGDRLSFRGGHLCRTVT